MAIFPQVATVFRSVQPPWTSPYLQGFMHPTWCRTSFINCMKSIMSTCECFPQEKTCQALHGVPHSHCWLFGIATLLAMLPTFNFQGCQLWVFYSIFWWKFAPAGCILVLVFFSKTLSLMGAFIETIHIIRTSLSIYPTCNVLLMFVGQRIISRYHEREDCYPQYDFDGSS